MSLEEEVTGNCVVVSPTILRDLSLLAFVTPILDCFCFVTILDKRDDTFEKSDSVVASSASIERGTIDKLTAFFKSSVALKLICDDCRGNFVGVSFTVLEM